jgi:ornithine cyclodeaminase/alanine dehydrogenase-like protein (mu-crystallin family)
LIGIHPIPGPDIYCGNVNKFRIRGLYLNARSLVNKTAELQALAVDADMIAVTETWLKPYILNTELLPGNHLQCIGGIEPIE